MNSGKELIQRILDIGKEIVPLLELPDKKPEIEKPQFEREILSSVYDGKILDRSL